MGLKGLLLGTPTLQFTPWSLDVFINPIQWKPTYGAGCHLTDLKILAGTHLYSWVVEQFEVNFLLNEINDNLIKAPYCIWIL